MEQDTPHSPLVLSASVPGEEERSIHIVTPHKMLQLGDIELEVAVGELPDGTYKDLLIGKKLQEIFGRGNRATLEDIDLLPACTDKAEKVHMPRFLSAKSLQMFMTPQMIPYFLPYVFKGHGVAKRYAYDAHILRHICVLYGMASDADLLHPSQAEAASRARTLSYSLMGVGISALIQEAVGWHRGDLAHQYNRYLLEVPSQWRRLFDREYCQLAFDLHGARYSSKHPRWFMGFCSRSAAPPTTS